MMKFYTVMFSAGVCLLSVFLLSGCRVEPKPAADSFDYTRGMSREERLEDAEKRRGSYYASQLTLFLDDTPKTPPGGIVFVGDSITDGFPLDKAFSGKNVINRGIGGDRIKGVTERLDVTVRDLHPEHVFLMIGVNDIQVEPDISPEKFRLKYAELLDRMIACSPSTEFIVFSLLPTRDKFAKHNSKIDEMNIVIRELAGERGLRFIDLQPMFSDSSGSLYAAFSYDGIHLSLEGYLAWLGEILSKKDFDVCVANLAPLHAEKYASSHIINKIDPSPEGKYPGNRGRDELVCYTPEYARSSTGTNPWGSEAVVREGVVTKHTNHDTPIPEDGFVVSGHRKASEWITTNLRPGMRARIEGDRLHIERPPSDQLTPAGRLRYLRQDLFEIMAEMKEASAPKKALEKAAAFFHEHLPLRAEDNPPSHSELDRIEEKLRRLR